MTLASFQPILTAFQQFALQPQSLLSDVMGTLAGHPLDAARDLLSLLEAAPLKPRDGGAVARAGLSYLQAQERLSSHPQATRVLSGPFKVLSELGRGCFGGVFLAGDTTGARAALKIYHQPFNAVHDDDVPLRGLLNELRFQSVVDDGFLVRILRCGLLEGARPYVALEYMPQGTLAERLKLLAGEEGNRDIVLNRILELTEAMLSAAAAIHGGGILHGDIGLRNFLVGIHGEVKLSDFAFARRVEEPPYRCELFGKKGQTPDGFSEDVFQLGKVVYQLATLYPYDISDQSIERAHEASRKRPDLELPIWIDDLIARAIRAPAKDRFQNAGEMLDFLRSHR